MTLNTLYTVTLALIVAITTGCTSTPAVTPADDRQQSQVRAQPVYIMPNCQTIGGAPVCQWISPAPGSSAPSVRRAQTVQGIAL